MTKQPPARFNYTPREQSKIIRYRQETIQRLAGPNGNTEKTPDTPLKSLTIKGMEIISRYRKADEFEVMRGMLMSLPEAKRHKIKRMFCDSQACMYYTVTLRQWEQVTAKVFANYFRNYALEHPPYGYNSIIVEGTDHAGYDQKVSLDADYGPGSPYFEELGGYEEEEEEPVDEAERRRRIEQREIEQDRLQHPSRRDILRLYDDCFDGYAPTFHTCGARVELNRGWPELEYLQIVTSHEIIAKMLAMLLNYAAREYMPPAPPLRPMRRVNK